MPATFGKRGRVSEPLRISAPAVLSAAPGAASSAQPNPEFVKWAKRVGAACLVVAVVLLRVYLLVSHFLPSTHQIPGLIPQAELPKTVADGATNSADLVARFPGDPRAHFYRAVKFLHDHDAVAAEQELRTALSERAVLTKAFSPKYEQGLHMMLALALLTQGRRDDANSEAQPVCNADVPELETVLRHLKNAGICN
jgi:hypothetical protein